MSKNHILHNLDMDEYRQMPGLSKHQFDWFCQSPAYYQWRKTQDFKASKEMILGTLIHAEALEGRVEYAVGPQVDRRTKAGKEAWEAFCLDNIGKEVVNEEDAARIKGAVSSAKQLLKQLDYEPERDLGKLWVEAALFWEDESFPGVQFKGRPDLIIPHPSGDVDQLTTIVDLKTTTDFFRFTSKFWQFGYNRQAAWYQWGLNQIGYSKTQFIFAVVDTDAPYYGQLMRLGKHDESVTWERLAHSLRHFVECNDRNDWPEPHTQGIKVIGHELGLD